MHLEVVNHPWEKLKKKKSFKPFPWGFSGGTLDEVVLFADIVMDTV